MRGQIDIVYNWKQAKATVNEDKGGVSYPKTVYGLSDHSQSHPNPTAYSNTSSDNLYDFPTLPPCWTKCPKRNHWFFCDIHRKIKQ